MTPSHHFASRVQAKMITNPKRSFRKHPKPPSQKVPKRPKTSNFLKTDVCWKTLSSKINLIWQLWPIRKVENARTLILFLSSFLKKTKKLDFHDQNIACYLKILISTPVFPWKSPFSFGALFDLFLVEHTGYDMILKYNQKVTF